MDWIEFLCKICGAVSSIAGILGVFIDVLTKGLFAALAMYVLQMQ